MKITHIRKEKIKNQTLYEFLAEKLDGCIVYKPDNYTRTIIRDKTYPIWRKLFKIFRVVDKEKVDVTILAEIYFPKGKGYTIYTDLSFAVILTDIIDEFESRKKRKDTRSIKIVVDGLSYPKYHVLEYKRYLEHNEPFWYLNDSFWYL